MNSTSSALFLYTELAGYTLACLRAAVEKGLEIHVVRWPVNKEAPFAFQDTAQIHLYNRSDLDETALIELVNKVKPSVILSSGWLDKGYLKVCRHFKREIPTVLLLDNHWNGTLKQRLAAVVSPITIQNTFSHCWVPGKKQFQYARKLKFSESNIQSGFYSADVPYFSQLFNETSHQKSRDFPRRFLYVGRYADFKGINELWSAFIEFRSAGNKDWELWCAGTGDMFDERIESDGIRHLGFVQPQEMREVIAQTGVFVLPSHKEPWGVVVHEFAAAGFPMMCSTAVGASEAFVAPGKNGILHQPANRKEILDGLNYFASKTSQELFAMGQISHNLAQKITPASWANTLMNYLPK